MDRRRRSELCCNLEVPGSCSRLRSRPSFSTARPCRKLDVGPRREPVQVKFLDEAKVHLRSGAGGKGCVSFRREAHVEFGGPDGGDGGRGGDVWAVADTDLNTLIDYRYRRHFAAGDGRPGSGRSRSGRHGRTIELKVPQGTEILEEDGRTVIADLRHRDDRVRLAVGGNGGFGNLHFKSATNQAPRRANPGQAGVERTVWLRLKVIADVGLVGLPNAGKSTFLAATSNARPRIADFPFTTTHPNLGMAEVDGQELVIADIPGLIEGAHQGRGIGDRFLRHVERCSVLLHLVDGTSDDIASDCRTIVRELAAYGQGIESKPRIVALNKVDALTPDDVTRKLAVLAGSLVGGEVGPALPVSAVAGSGVADVLRAVRTHMVPAVVEEGPPWQP